METSDATMPQPSVTGPRGARIISFETFMKRRSAGREPGKGSAISPFGRLGWPRALNSRQITHRRVMLNYLRTDR